MNGKCVTFISFIGMGTRQYCTLPISIAISSLLVSIVLFSAPMAAAELRAMDQEFLHDTFPKGFKWGVATSAFQTEGGWDADGKGESMWDRFTHQVPSPIMDKSTADIACDSYHKYREDVQLVKNLVAKVYRFSISWARVLPKGTVDEVNQAGIDYYNNLINELIKQGIEPMVTLFHWDLPQALQEEGGWLNESIIQIFGDYARICYQNFGDRVTDWITINEPWVFSILGYNWGHFAPGLKEPAESPYKVVHNILKAHATAYHIYKSEFVAIQNGRIGLSADSWWYEPKDPHSAQDKEAAERALQFRLGWIVHPLLKGDYPPIMRSIIQENSKLEGRTSSRLPKFEPEWIERIKGSIDFLGLNHYTTELVTPANSSIERPGWDSDFRGQLSHDPAWPSTGSVWLKMAPWGLRKLLNWIKNEYGNPEVIITENGVSDKGGTLEDAQRIEYFTSYINQVLKAVKKDNCKVTGYLAWSLLDVYEWSVGYLDKFGIHSVDFNHPDRPRTPKASAKALTQIFQDNGFPVKASPSSTSTRTALIAMSTILIALILIL